MKLLKRILITLGLLIVLALIGGYFFLNHVKTVALPDYSKDVQIPGLTGEVTILRDSFAIPHIYAENEADLYRAVGFTMAQDRLWQMDLLRRVTQGRLSEIMGKDQLNTDLLMRALRIQEKSKKVLAQSSPEIVAALEAFSAGVNFYMEKYPLPPEYRILNYKPEPWQPVHSINLIGYMSWDLTSGWGIEIFLHQLAKEVSSEHIIHLIPDSETHSTPVFSNEVPVFIPDEIIL
ncbi:MAG TPA: hypothetical protein ENN90_09900, partial [Mariniphaga anaerophila]|nr:hypothetical protein [Mariniphaga anaerophila]